jgi:hypothetical protein
MAETISGMLSPPMAMNEHSSATVAIQLDEWKPEGVALTDPFPVRTFTLRAPDYTVSVGRATTSGTGPRASPNNAYFNSRVVSRDHAVLKADPVTREVFVSDNGSMHGTHVRGRRLKHGIFQRLFDQDKVIFGAEVARATGTIDFPIDLTTEQTNFVDVFAPVAVILTFDWSASQGEDNSVSWTRPTQSYGFNPTDEEDDDEDSDDSDDSDDFSETSAQPPYNNFAVPESDISDDGNSIMSSSDLHDIQDDSPTSSPAEFSADGKQRIASAPDPRFEFPRVASPSLGGPPDNEDIDSYYEDSSIFEGDVDLGEHPVLDFSEIQVTEIQNRPSQAPILPTPSGLLSPPPRPVRDPSPSDAAMVKPIEPLFHSASADPASPFVPGTMINRDNSAWAGHNSILYDPFPDSMVPDTFGYDNNMVNNDFQNPFDSYHGGAMAYGRVDPAVRTRLSFVPEPEAITSAATRISTARSKKRKADEMGESSAVADENTRQVLRDILIKPATAPTIIPAAPESSVMATASTMIPETVPTTTIETVESVKSPAPAEPARKKIKTNNAASSATNKVRGSSFKSHAVTAAISATLGAAGLLGTLMALPKDFFA